MIFCNCLYFWYLFKTTDQNHKSRVPVFLETHSKPFKTVNSKHAGRNSKWARNLSENKWGVATSNNEKRTQCAWLFVPNTRKTTAMPPCSLPLPVYLQPLQRKYHSLCFWRWVRVITWRKMMKHVCVASQPENQLVPTPKHQSVGRMLLISPHLPITIKSYQNLSNHVKTYHVFVTSRHLMTFHDISWPKKIVGGQA